MTAALTLVIKKNHDDDDVKGRFKVAFSCSDICDSQAKVTAKINGIAVQNGQVVKLKLTAKPKVKKEGKKKGKKEDGILVIKAPSFSLVATCTDASGNVGTATATPSFAADDDDDDDDD